MLGEVWDRHFKNIIGFDDLNIVKTICVVVVCLWADGVWGWGLQNAQQETKQAPPFHEDPSFNLEVPVLEPISHNAGSIQRYGPSECNLERLVSPTLHNEQGTTSDTAPWI